MRRLNRSAVLDIVRERGRVTRTEIAAALGISSATVMRIVDELVEEQLVVWSGDSEASGGRPRMLLEFNPEAYAVIGLDLGGTKMFGTVADLGGKLQHEVYIPWEEGGSNAAGDVNRVYELIECLLAAPRPAGQTVRGIGVGAPGVTLSEAGIVQWAPGLNWRDLPLRDLLQERFQLPVFVENDVNLAALGEYGFGLGKGAHSLVCITVGTGIGAGIVINRNIHKGFTHSAGEIGYLPPDISYLGKRYPGYGPLESIASGSGVEARARQYLIDQGQSVPPDLSAELVFDAARSGAAWARQIVDGTVDYLSMAIAVITAVLDPEVIVLGGGVAHSADLLLDPIRARIDGLVPSMPRLLQSDLGSRAAVMGAILLVLDATTKHVAVINPS